MKKFLFPILLLVCLYLPSNSHAWTGAIKNAFNAVAEGTATPQQQALAFKNNFTLNMMAEQGEYPLDEFSKVQQQFQNQAYEFIAGATEDAGLGYKIQSADPNKPATFKPGTDVDGHALRNPNTPNQQLTLEDVKAAREAFNNRINQYLVENGLEPLENPSKALTVDIMPAEAVSVSEVVKSAEYINADGGTMYRDHAAAQVESSFRGAKNELSLTDYARYVSEQQRQIVAHNETQHLTEEIKQYSCAEEGSDTAIERENLKGKVQLEAEQTGKYQERINRAANKLSNQYLGENADLPVNNGRAASELVTANRGPGGQLTAATVDGLRENTTLANTESFVDTVAKIAQENPAMRVEANAAIAEATRNLTPAQRGAILERMRANPALGGEAGARGAAEAMRANAVPDAPDKLNSRLVQGPVEPPTAAPGLGQKVMGKIQSVDAATGTALGVGELDATASGMRRGLNTLAGGAASAAGVALTAKQLNDNAIKYKNNMNKAMNPNTTDAEANKAFENAEEAGWDTAKLGAAGAVAEAVPVIGGGTLVLVGSYMGTKVVMQNTETGRAVNAGVTNAYDTMNILDEKMTEGLKGLIGMENQASFEERQLRARQDAWRGAIERGEVKLKPPHTMDELMAQLANSESKSYQADLMQLIQIECHDEPKKDDGVKETGDVDWNGSFADQYSVVSLSGGGSSLSGSFNYKVGESSGSGGWSGCKVDGPSATCNWTCSHDDTTKTGTRKGTLTVSLSGDTISGQYNEEEPKWNYKEGYSKDNISSSMHEGAVWPFTMTRK